MKALYLSDVLKLSGISLEETLLIRHSLSHENFRLCYDMGGEMITEFTRLQSGHFSDRFKYWLVFIGDKGTDARFFAAYEAAGKIKACEAEKLSGFPCPNMYADNEVYRYDIKETELLADYKGKLLIDWGKSAVSWHQSAANEKRITAISTAGFPGYDKLILSFAELKNICDNPNMYENYISAMKAVNAVYLIADRKSGRQYVGSAAGANGLYGRWEEYVKTSHGGNAGLKEHLQADNADVRDLQFSILQIFSRTERYDNIIACENLWKEKLLTRSFGFNQN